MRYGIVISRTAKLRSYKVFGDLYKPKTPHGTKSNTPVLATTTTCNEEAASDSYMNPKPGFQTGSPARGTL